MQGEFSSMPKRMRLTGKDRREDRKGERKERRGERKDTRRESWDHLGKLSCSSLLCSARHF
jgi:hypothetical protein